MRKHNICYTVTLSKVIYNKCIQPPWEQELNKNHQQIVSASLPNKQYVQYEYNSMFSATSALTFRKLTFDETVQLQKTWSLCL